jgi:hypothetical protein
MPRIGHPVILFPHCIGMLDEKDNYAARQKLRYADCGSIMECIEGQYDL